VRGIEAESVLTFSGLLAIARPLRGYAQAVPPAQSAALYAALGWRAGDGGDGGPYSTVRNPALPMEESGVFAERAELR
jgi:hypothetical protein